MSDSQKDFYIKKEIFPFKEIVGEINVPNKKLCKIVYDVVDGDSDFEISLRDFLRNKNLQKKRGNKLTLEILQNLGGFNDITLKGFQSDLRYELQKIEVDTPFEFDYLVSKNCFLFYFSHPRTETHLSSTSIHEQFHYIRLDDLFSCGFFRHTATQYETDNDRNDTHIPSLKLLNKIAYLQRVKDIHNFYTAFHQKHVLPVRKNGLLLNHRFQVVFN